MSDEINNQPRIIDTKLPLVWLISSAASVVFAMGGIYIKLDNVSIALTKLEVKVDQRDDRIGLLQTNVIQAQGRNDTQQTQINRLESDVSGMKSQIDANRQANQRYMPR